MVKVKICGITNLEDALNSVDAGCDALGFVFYKKSPRYIAPEKAYQIAKNIAPRIIKIGVFVNAKTKNIQQIAKLCRLDMLQFHGSDSPAFCHKFKNYKVIKTFRIKDKLDLRSILKYKVFAYLFDTFSKNKPGGTGKKFNWKLLRELGNIKHPIFLSGGLNKNNVLEAIEVVNPDWVDVSSSVEIKPGKKDNKLIERFIKIVKKG